MLEFISYSLREREWRILWVAGGGGLLVTKEKKRVVQGPEGNNSILFIFIPYPSSYAHCPAVEDVMKTSCIC